ncbi:hypothetical protein [Arthrobacter silvisoli]|uniref:hypothetical protein n=1 Tax=Arthrobacter silvisoli TaxID=2291022 RepID=UPI000E217D4A|nr:hypothetical protein [Arthrobacter silvisoli]
MSKNLENVTDLPERKPSPSDPFDVGAERSYPRASVRRQADGRWRLTLWDAPGVFHVLEGTGDELGPDYPDPYSAFGMGWLIIGAHRKTGTRLNGMAA